MIINRIAAKFEEMTVILQSIDPANPLTNTTETIHPNSGMNTHLKDLNIKNRIKIKNKKTPTPNFSTS